MGVWLSVTKIKVWHSCHLAYRLRYIDRLEPPGPRPPMLLVGDLLHKALAIYFSDPPRGEAEVVGLVERAVAMVERPLEPREEEQARVEVASRLLELHHRPETHLVPRESQFEVPLRTCTGPLYIFARADAVWTAGEDGGESVHLCEWKLSPPSLGDLHLQMCFLHAGARVLYPDIPIRRWLLSFRPEIRVSEVALSEETFRHNLSLALETAREIAREREWRPNPGSACGSCDYALVCEHAAARLGAVPF